MSQGDETEARTRYAKLITKMERDRRLRKERAKKTREAREEIEEKKAFLAKIKKATDPLEALLVEAEGYLKETRRAMQAARDATAKMRTIHRMGKRATVVAGELAEATRREAVKAAVDGREEVLRRQMERVSLKAAMGVMGQRRLLLQRQSQEWKDRTMFQSRLNARLRRGANKLRRLTAESERNRLNEEDVRNARRRDAGVQTGVGWKKTTVKEEPPPEMSPPLPPLAPLPPQPALAPSDNVKAEVKVKEEPTEAIKLEPPPAESDSDCVMLSPVKKEEAACSDVECVIVLD